MFSYTTNVSAHDGVTLKRKKSTTIKHTIHSKINNERVYIDYGFRVSSTALLCWISEIWKKEKKNRKPLKLTLTHKFL